MVLHCLLCLPYMCVCVLHIKPLFLPVGIQNNQCPCRFFNSRRDTSSVVTKLRHRYVLGTNYQRTLYSVVCLLQRSFECLSVVTTELVSLLLIGLKNRHGHWLVVLDVDGWKERFNVKNTQQRHKPIYVPLFLRLQQ